LLKNKSAPVCFKREVATVIRTIEGIISKMVSNPFKAPVLKAFVISFFDNRQKTMLRRIKIGKRKIQTV